MGVSSAGPVTGAARLSSARVVRCSVKSANERNPYRQLYFSGETASVNGEEGGDDVKSAWLLRPGLHTCYNGNNKGSQNRKAELIPKSCLSSDWGLQLALMKLESLVIVGQPYHGEYVLKPCTHRPSSEPSRQRPKPSTLRISAKLTFNIQLSTWNNLIFLLILLIVVSCQLIVALFACEQSAGLRQGRQGALSRNKVSVGESADGSPPF